MRSPLRELATAALLALVPPTPANAQARLVEPWGATSSPTYERWWFSSLVATDSYVLSGVEQATIPLALSFSPLRSWRVDVSGAYSRGRVHTVDPTDGGQGVLELDGLTDARLRAVGHVLDERLWLTLGVDLPIGLTGLSADEALAVRALGAPALRMRTPVLGSGTGVTAGALFATPLGGWAIAAGASFEIRGTYTPLDMTLADGFRVGADLNPGEVLHLTLGLDGIAGQGRVSLLLSMDRYGQDDVSIRATGTGPAAETVYRLGPTYGVTAEYRARVLGTADMRLSLRGRHRSEYSDAGGRSVTGSSGSVMEAGLSVRFGRPRGLGLVVALEGLHDTGLDVDSSVATAAMTSGAATIGLTIPSGRLSLQPFVRGRIGTLDLGPVSTGVRGLSAGLSLSTGAS